MKTIVLSISLLISTVFNNTFASCSYDFNGVIQEVVKFEKGELILEKNQTAFVKISFKINEDGKIEVLEINYSDEVIKDKLIKKLSLLNLYGIEDCKKVYNYNFTFEKH